MLFCSTIMKRWCQPLGLHTRSSTNSFVCNFLSSSAGSNLCSCFFRLTLVVSDFSGPSVPRPVAASLPLSDPRCFRVLSSASVLGSDYSAFCFFLSVSRSSASQLLPCSPPPLSLPRFPRSLQPGFPCFPSRFFVLGFLFVSFRPSLIRSHSRSSGASLVLSPSGFSASRPLPCVHFRSASGYSASCSSFPLSPLPPHSGFHSSRFRSRFLVFRLPSRLVSHALLPASRTRLSVCFLSLFPASLPTAVPQVLPLRSRLRAFPLPFRFLSSASGPLPATQPLLLPFRSSRLRLTVASPVRRLRSRFLGFPRSSQPGFPCLLSRFFVLGFLFVSFRPTRLRSHSCSTGASLLFRFLASASLPGFSAPIRFLSSADLHF